MKCLKCKQETKTGTAVFDNGHYLGVICVKCNRKAMGGL